MSSLHGRIDRFNCVPADAMLLAVSTGPNTPMGRPGPCPPRIRGNDTPLVGGAHATESSDKSHCLGASRGDYTYSQSFSHWYFSGRLAQARSVARSNSAFSSLSSSRRSLTANAMLSTCWTVIRPGIGAVMAGLQRM